VIEVRQQIDAVTRQVGERPAESGRMRTVTISQVYDAEVADVWDACTTADRIRRWFLPISGDLRVGGSYQIEGNASGKVERCDPPHSFAATWEFGGMLSWIEVRLTAAAEGTRFELSHVAPEDDKWGEFGPGAVGIGWDSALLGLALHLAGAPGMDPAEAAAWVTSPEGREFMTLSGTRWIAADIAAGTDPSTAQAAGTRTIGAYTGQPADGDSTP
jgi:uncharacterized protein YndB with AHSA1/START domain